MFMMLQNASRIRTMKGYWQRHLLNAKEELAAISDAVAPEAIDNAADGMDQDASVALFGREFLPAQRRHTTRKEWKGRQPFVPKKHDFRPKPWSELKQPVGLPSFMP